MDFWRQVEEDEEFEWQEAQRLDREYEKWLDMMEEQSERYTQTFEQDTD